MPKNNDLWVFDVIGKGIFESGVTAEFVKNELAGFDKGKPLAVHIDSPGGSANEGRTIYNLLKEWDAGVDVTVYGQAASAASLIAMAGREIVMAEGAAIMIHNAWTMVLGDSAELRKAADFLDQWGEQLAKTYSKRTGIEIEQIREMMDAETWMFDEEAVRLGFADRVKEDIKAAAFVVPESFGFKAPPVPPRKPEQRPHNRLAAQERQLQLYRQL